jgi:hypothetical protein
MKKILCYIASFTNHSEFYKVLETVLSYKKYKLDVIIYTTDPVNPIYLLNNVKVITYDKSIKENLVTEHRKHIPISINDYDLFLYLENDIIINESTLDTFIEENSLLDDNTTVGFIRYEDCNNKKYLNEFMPGCTHNHLPTFKTINNKLYFTLNNVHQGCYLLEQRHLKKFISNNQFTLNLGPGLEAAASNFYKSNLWPGLPNTLEKVYPVDKLEQLLIHHASNKHTKTNTGFLTFDQLLDIIPK